MGTVAIVCGILRWLALDCVWDWAGLEWVLKGVGRVQRGEKQVGRQADWLTGMEENQTEGTST